jgi:hypothetical protein
VRGGGFILDSECTSRVIKLDSKQNKKHRDTVYNYERVRISKLVPARMPAGNFDVFSTERRGKW